MASTPARLPVGRSVSASTDRERGRPTVKSILRRSAPVPRALRSEARIPASFVMQPIHGDLRGCAHRRIAARARPADRQPHRDRTRFEPLVACVADPLDVIDRDDLVGLGHQDGEATRCESGDVVGLAREPGDRVGHSARSARRRQVPAGRPADRGRPIRGRRWSSGDDSVRPGRPRDRRRSRTRPRQGASDGVAAWGTSGCDAAGSGLVLWCTGTPGVGCIPVVHRRASAVASQHPTCRCTKTRAESRPTRGGALGAPVASPATRYGIRPTP